jgi:hypothetical protein
VKRAVATEANNYRKLFKNRGLEVSEDKSNIITLSGERVGYHSISGIKPSSFKITVRLSPAPQSVTVVISAESEDEAQRAASKLEELGFNVDVDGERVYASSKRVTLSNVAKAIDVAERASEGKRQNRR